MKLRLLLLLLITTVDLCSLASTTAFDPAYVAVFFANPYPLSQVASLRGLLMVLWSEVQAVPNTQESYAAWQTTDSPFFTDRLLDISTLIDVLCQQQAASVEDKKSLLILIEALEKRLYTVTAGMQSDQLGCLTIVLERIKKKMEQTF